MRSLDTNILARFIIRDDAAQTSIADAVMRSDALITATVLLETAWLLASRLKMSRAAVADSLAAVVAIANVRVAEEPRVIWAIERMRAGADFADMLHLVQSREADRFTTFDCDLRRDAGADAPIAVETLKS